MTTSDIQTPGIKLKDYHFKSNFIKIDDFKVHYIDEGEKENPTILMLHGVPTWSYTFRNIIPSLVNEGFRVVAPDLPGFGMSDKPTDKNVFNLEKLVSWVDGIIETLNLKARVFLVAHDWGVIIGLILTAQKNFLFSGIVACNGFLPDVGQNQPLLFKIWKLFTKYSPFLPAGRIVDFGCKRKLKKEERMGYNYPFSHWGGKVAIRILPQLIPTNENSSGYELIKESNLRLRNMEKPFLTVFSDNDPITRGGEKLLQKLIPGAKNQPHVILKGKHFIQEDAPLEMSRIIIDFVKNNL